jgi:hypothetical protein
MIQGQRHCDLEQFPILCLIRGLEGIAPTFPRWEVFQQGQGEQNLTPIRLRCEDTHDRLGVDGIEAGHARKGNV